jgi:hypothetical protein
VAQQLEQALRRTPAVSRSQDLPLSVQLTYPKAGEFISRDAVVMVAQSLSRIDTLHIDYSPATFKRCDEHAGSLLERLRRDGVVQSVVWKL